MKKPAKTSNPISQRDYILLDRSGSMATKWDDTLGAVNAYVHALARDKATAKIKVTLAVFDTEGPFDTIRRDIEADDWSDATSLEASPRGGTPLYDAIGRLVSLARTDAPDRAAIVVVTDGAENASRGYNKASAKALLDGCRAKGWQVIFLGVNFDNMSQSRDMGTYSAQTISVAPMHMAGTMAATATMRSAYATSGQAMNYTAEIKDKVKPRAR